MAFIQAAERLDDIPDWLVDCAECKTDTINARRELLFC